MRYSAVDADTLAPINNTNATQPGQRLKYQYLPRIRCHDCPGKLYTPGPAMTVDNFEVHLKNRQHRERVEERLARAAASAEGQQQPEAEDEPEPEAEAQAGPEQGQRVSAGDAPAPPTASASSSATATAASAQAQGQGQGSDTVNSTV